MIIKPNQRDMQHVTKHHNVLVINQPCVNSKTTSGSGGIRTHAPEGTGALNQRLRPLGHATLIKDACLSQFSICVQPIYSAAMFLYGWATFLKRDQLQ